MTKSPEIQTEEILLCFAHRGEAKAFLQEFKSSAVEENFYSLDTDYEGLDIYLLITGEGFEESMTSLSLTLGLKPQISKVINYGVCGLLRKELDLKVNDLVAIRSVYADSLSEKTMSFKSFQLSSKLAKWDLVSTHDRVLNGDKANTLDNFAPLVDRELWAMAYSAHKRSIPLESYKVISDYADGEICQSVKEEAPLWSDLMLRHFMDLFHNPSPQESKESFLSQFLRESESSFHITLSQERALERLLQAHFIKGNSFDYLKERMKFEEIILEKKRPKDKTKKIILELTELLNPMEVKLKRELKSITFGLEKLGVQVKHDQDFDKEKLYLNTTLQSKEDFNRLAQALQDFPFEKWSATLRGEDHV